MILPLPVPHQTAETAVEFINLETYPSFFDDLFSGFPLPRGASKSTGDLLEVVSVGSLAASFVPSAADFDRLDPQFRLPKSAWVQLPIYHDYGFAVFQLKKGAQKVHPMALKFPSAQPERLFFPTVHIHDQTVPATAEFQHDLFCQPPGDQDLSQWTESTQPAAIFMKVSQSGGLLDPLRRCYRKTLSGKLKNEDIWLS